MGLDYKADPNDSTKQVPAGNISENSQSINVNGYHINPGVATVGQSPDSVILHTTGSYSFLYESTSSVGTSIPRQHASMFTQMITCSATPVQSYPITLNISPVAWSGSRSTTAVSDDNDVSFVYNGNR